MSDQIAALLSRIAALESEVAPLRAKQREQPSGITPEQFRQAYVSDPIGTLTRMGLGAEHILHSTRVHVAHAMGDQAPPELKVLASMGPQVSATNTLASEVQSLRQRVEQQDKEARAKAVRESVKALAVDKTKYPNLAKAMTADPGLFDADLASHGGTAEEFAAAQEARLAKVAALYAPPPASPGDADDQTAKSEQAMPALASTMGGDPPPIPQPKVGVFTAEDHQKLKDEIVRKYASAT